MWAIVALIIGFILGVLGSILVVFIMYRAGVGLFSSPQGGRIECRSVQYIEDPSVALREGYQFDDILSFVNGNILYKRPPRDVCTPGSNQTVTIQYPQYCIFTARNGTQEEWRDAFFNANVYQRVGGIAANIERTNGNCQPRDSTRFSAGVTEFKWTP